MENHNDQELQKLHNRLIRLQGQLGGIDRMITEERDCTEVFQQFAAVRAALQRTVAAYQQKMVNDCLVKGEGSLTERKKLASGMIDLINRF